MWRADRAGLDHQILGAVALRPGLRCTAGSYRRLAKRVKEQEEERKAIKAGLLAILHDRLYAECSRCLAQGSIDTDAMRNLEYLYRSYHALGGNGTGTELYNRAKALPIRND